jgi:NAD(P)-dependent dehydrogenase (short-subunit alcohol dehydrogenase family)
MYEDIFSCKNKIAIVTGGCGLIGRELVRGLADFGAVVYAADTDGIAAKKHLDHDNVIFLQADITSQDSVIAGIEKVKGEQGRIDILVNTAFPRTGDWMLKAESVPFDSWKQNVNDHLGGYFICCQAVAEEMKKKRSGSIINFASTYGVVAPDFSIYEGTPMTSAVAYSAIKGGLITFTKYLASYYSKYNIRVNSISPGGVFDNQHPEFVANYSKRALLGRMAKASEIVGAAVFLASDAASYITGHNLMVDGGWTAC